MGLLHRFFLFVCVLGQTLTSTQYHTNVYKYVKYVAQSCCESVMDIFFFFFFFYLPGESYHSRLRYSKYFQW